MKLQIDTTIFKTLTGTMETIRTPITDRLGIKYPILLAGMSGVSHGELAAAVSNAGGKLRHLLII